MTKADKVFLVNAANDPIYASMSNDYSFPALGVLALGSWIKRNVPDIEVTCRDGAARSMEQIIEEIHQAKPDLVGVSTLCTSYQNSLTIASEAKKAGAKVVFGNDQASQTARLILQHRPQVDFVIGHEYGELDLELLIRNLRGENIPLNKIPSLTFRDENGTTQGFDFNDPEHKKRLSLVSPTSGYQLLLSHPAIRGRKGALDIFPLVDRTLYPQDHWETYLRNYNQRFAGLHVSPVGGVTTINRAARGCNRQGEDKCKHCDMLLDISTGNPNRFWEEVALAHAQVGATSFYEVCDSLSSFPGVIKELAENKPKLRFNPEFYVYCQAVDLANHPERVDALKQLGVFRINMGLESMDDRTLKHMKGEKDSVENNDRALQLCKDAGIHVYGSFVLGSEAETLETLRTTVERVCDLIKNKYLCDAEAQPVLPLPGNYQGRILASHGLMTNNSREPDWPVDVDYLSRTYINTFSGVSYDDCVAAANQIRECAKRNNINYGSGVSKRSNYRV